MLEVAIKASLGKLEIPTSWVEQLLSEGFSILAITPGHAQALRELPFVEMSGKPQRDPFDRLLVAQAQIERIPIVSRDGAIAAHGVATIW